MTNITSSFTRYLRFLLYAFILGFISSHHHTHARYRPVSSRVGRR